MQGRQLMAEASQARETSLPLLASKVTIPSESLEVMHRPRLSRALEAGLDRPVTLVSASPGGGKTTFLSSWAHTTTIGWPIAWLALEAADTGRRFWSYLHATLSAALAGLAALPVPEEALGVEYLTQLAAVIAGLATPVVLILDDFQEVSDEQALAGLAFLVRHAGTPLRLVLSTRSEPPLPLPMQRWRVCGQLSELRTDALSFTAREGSQLLDAGDPRLSDAQRNTLHTRAEGWPAGLRLAALALQTNPDPDGYVQDFGGTHGSVREYLRDEVLAPQPDDAREALLCSAILAQMCGELVDALTGGTNGEWLFTELERTNSFVVPLAGRLGWYRYRQLFGDMLFAELHRQAPERIGKLNRRAAAWQTASGRHVPAVRHALAAQDWQTATRLLTAHWHEFELTGDGEALRTALAPPPIDSVQADPSLALAFAVDRLDVGDHPGAAAFLRLADAHRHRVREEQKEQFALMAGALRLTEANLRGEPADILPLAPRSLLEAIAVEELSPRELGVLHYLQSPLSNAEIAGELCLSVNTVKTHVSSIFRKLRVAHRREAIRRARELHLL